MNLLDNTIIAARLNEGGETTLTLPQALAGLAWDGITSFNHLQAHQRQGWHCLLVQLAALALLEAGLDELPEDASQWRQLLLGLTAGYLAPWNISSPAGQPAFLQPSSGPLDDFDEVETPDLLDILVTSKGHDVKRKRITHPSADHWLFALVNAQTMASYGGRYKWGVMRMNGGYGSRPLFSVSPGLSWGARWRHDVEVLLCRREEIAEESPCEIGGHRLLWLLPWSGGKREGLKLEQIDPYCVEVARRIRLVERDGELACLYAGAKKPRVATPNTYAGVSGDPWAPTLIEEGKLMTPGASGLHFEMMQRVLFSAWREDVTTPATMRDFDGARYFIAQVLVNGMGQTSGLHECVIELPENVVKVLKDSQLAPALAVRAQERVDAAKLIGRVLYPALMKLLGAEQRSREVDLKVRVWTDAYLDAVDEINFGQLWQSLELDDEAAAAAWWSTLSVLAEAQLKLATERFGGGTQGFKRVASAENILHAGLRNPMGI